MHRKKKNHRLSKLGPIGVALLVIPVVAIALIVHTLYISGSISTGDAGVKYSTGAGVVTNSGDCAGSYADDQHLNLTWTGNPFPGDSCNITIAFASDSATVDMKLQGMNLPAGLDGLLGGDCGKLITVNQTATPAAALDLAIAADHPSGTAIVLTADTFGFEWVPAVDFISANCA